MVISPATLISGADDGAGDGRVLEQICGFHHGRIVAAMALPRNVTAMTRVASSVSAAEVRV